MKGLLLESWIWLIWTIFLSGLMCFETDFFFNPSDGQLVRPDWYCSTLLKLRFTLITYLCPVACLVSLFKCFTLLQFEVNWINFVIQAFSVVFSFSINCSLTEWWNYSVLQRNSVSLTTTPTEASKWSFFVLERCLGHFLTLIEI